MFYLMAGELLVPPNSTDIEHRQSFAARRDSVLQPSIYESVALTDATNQIRVCSIHPGPVDSKLRVSFRTINLDPAAEQYICLSYVWGDTATTKRILLNDHDHLIRRNLHLQLLRLRANGMTQLVWCDALCINQTDPGERGTQVAMMDRIFSGAARVVFGLDDCGKIMLRQPANKDVLTLQAIIQRLSDDSHLNKCLSCFALDYKGRATSSDFKSVAAVQFRRLVNSSFWSRCWTVQEVVLAKDAVVMGEWGIIHWSLVLKAFERYNHHRMHCCGSYINTLDANVRASCYKLFCHVESLEHTKKKLQQGQQLVELLRSFGELHATVKRDKLFAFWGLAEGPLPEPDYVNSTQMVCTNIAKWILEKSNDLSLLAMGLPADPDLPGLPSWVPSLSAPTLEINYHRHRMRCLDAYDCARGIPCSIQFEGDQKLRLQGVLVDEVADVAKEKLVSFDIALSLHAALLRDWRSFASACLTNEQMSDDVFHETLIAGCSKLDAGGHLDFPAATSSDLHLCKDMFSRLMSGRDFDNDANRFALMEQAHLAACFDRVLFRTKAGRLGLGPSSLVRGNEVWAIGGAPAPFVIQRTLVRDGQPTYHLVGHAYVNGIMHGEAVDQRTAVRTCLLV